MNYDFLSSLDDREKVVLFNVALKVAKESGESFESKMGAAVNALMIKKEYDREINMATTPPFEADMNPTPMFTTPPFENQTINNNYQMR